MCHGIQTAKRLLSTLLPDFGEMNLFMFFSPFSLILDILNKGGKGESSSNCSILAHTNMVSSTSAYADKFSSNVTWNEKSVDTTIRLISDTPTETENEHDGLSLIREGFKRAGIPTLTQDIMFKS